MLRIIQNSSSAGAKSYYSTSDYYTEGQELVGMWRGEGAKRLGLWGETKKIDWDALCDNLEPSTGKALTPRRKSDRTVGYDFNFDVPKSVSLLYVLTKDERIMDAFRSSVHETMQDIERDVKTRVRSGGKNEDRTTGNAVWGEFVHLTARPVDGVPDPNLHAHCFVFNTTFDRKEDRWKAGQFRDLKRDAPYFEALAHSRLARRLADLGLPIERTRTGWQIEGIPKSALDKFSRRTKLIEEKARENGITDAKEKGELGAKTRERKKKDLTFDELRKLWADKLTSDESTSIRNTARLVGGRSIVEDERAAGEAIAISAEHWFERKSVVPERQLLATALKQSFGKASVAAVEREFKKRDFIWADRDGQRLTTTRDVLKEEMRMLDFARKGRGSRKPLGSKSHQFHRDWLNEDQRNAVLHVLNSNDRVILIRGAAGTGKTTMMQEAIEGIEAGGKRVFTFAPSADASRNVLRDAGFKDADTVARLLIDQKLQERVRGQAVWIDEAGQLGTRTVAMVFDMADKLDARVILSGDRYQHGSVERGAALRLLETEAGLVSAEIRDIQRQEAEYKSAVKALSEGHVVSGFDQLDKLGWVKEVGDSDRSKMIAADYVAAIKAGQTALVVSPTHWEGEWISKEIRSELKHVKALKGEERQFGSLVNANLTLGQRRDSLNYQTGDVMVFHQNATGYRKGQRLVVGEDQIPRDQAERFQVFRPRTLPLAAGDVIRVTQNGRTADDLHRVDNRATYRVKAFTKSGDIELTNGWKISRDFGHLTHGYVVTSYASQGKTVDKVFIGQSSYSFAASNREQFYVSVSRGRKQATIYTDNKKALLDAVEQTDERLSATELVTMRDRRERYITKERTEHQLTEAAERATKGRERELVNER